MHSKRNRISSDMAQSKSKKDMNKKRYDYGQKFDYRRDIVNDIPMLFSTHHKRHDYPPIGLNEYNDYSNKRSQLSNKNQNINLSYLNKTYDKAVFPLPQSDKNYKGCNNNNRKSVPNNRKAERSEKKQSKTISNQDNFNKVIEQCTEKLEYYKLMTSLQEQKRLLLQKENRMFKSQIKELKVTIEQYKKQMIKLGNRNKELLHKQQKVKKYQKQVDFVDEQRKLSQEMVDEDMIISLGNKRQFRKIQADQNNKINRDFLHSKSNKKKRQTQNHQKGADNQFINEFDYPNKNQTQCQRCKKLQDKLSQERELYEKDRIFLRDQLQIMQDSLDEEKRKNKREKKLQTTYEEELIQSKKQLAKSYNVIEEQCSCIQVLEGRVQELQRQNLNYLKDIKGKQRYSVPNKKNSSRQKILFKENQDFPLSTIPKHIRIKDQANRENNDHLIKGYGELNLARKSHDDERNNRYVIDQNYLNKTDIESKEYKNTRKQRKTYFQPSNQKKRRRCGSIKNISFNNSAQRDDFQ